MVVTRHWNQYIYNQEFRERLEDDPHDHYDWKITVNFYIALHLLCHYIELKGTLGIPENHQERFKLINFNSLFKSVRNDYSNLFDLGNRSRYSGFINQTQFEKDMLKDLIMSDSYLKSFITNMMIMIKEIPA